MGADVAIGRDSKNAIHLDDSSVASCHCVITVEDGRLILSDLDSRTGTFVNGIPVKRRELKPGDEIAVGNSIFLLEAETPQSAASSPVEMYEHETQQVRALEFRPQELLSLEPNKLAALPQTARMERNLSALLQISRAIGSLRDEQSLPWQLLGMIFDVIPAERGAILLLEDGSHEVRSQVAWDRKAGPDQPVHISQGIVTARRRRKSSAAGQRRGIASGLFFACR